MSDDLSIITPVTPNAGKYQWVQGKVTGIDGKQTERTHTVGVPHLMPGVIIFVHGVNSDGEWYSDASREFAKGLNVRLGRPDDLKGLEKDTKGDGNKVTAHRYLKSTNTANVSGPWSSPSGEATKPRPPNASRSRTPANTVAIRPGPTNTAARQLEACSTRFTQNTGRVFS